MAVTRVQTFAVANKSDGSGSVVTRTMTSAPTAGNLVVACLSNGDSGGDISIVGGLPTDTFLDGGTWIASSLNPQGLTVGSNTRYRIYYKVVGTPTLGGSDVVVTISGTQALQLFVAEYGVDSGTPNWAVDGTPVAANGTTSFPADAGDITTSGSSDVLVGFSGCGGAPWNAGTNFTRQATSSNWASDAVEDRLVSSPSTYAVDWTSAGGDDLWVALGIAFQSDAGGGATTAALSSAGSGSSTFTSQSSVTSALSAAGLAAVTFRSQSNIASPFSSAGSGTVNWVGAQAVAGAFSIAGVAAVNWRASSFASAPVSAAGTATVAWNTASSIQGVISSAGTSTVNWVGAAQADGAGELHSAGASTVLWGAQSSIGAGLSAAGFSTVAWAAAAAIDAQISSSGTSTVAWEGAEITPSIASGAFSMAGSSSVRWVGRNANAVTRPAEGRKRRRIDDDEEEIMQIIAALAPAVFEQWYD